MIGWVVKDWKQNRFRLVCETFGSLCFLIALGLMSWYGDDVSVKNVLTIQVLGGSFHAINAYLRKSLNLLVLNVIVNLMCISGLIKMSI